MANGVIDPKLPGLPDETDPNSPLKDYEPATSAERQQEIDDFEQQPVQTPIDTLNDILDTGEDIKDTVDQVKDLNKKVTGKGAQASTEGAAEAGAEGTLEGAASRSGATIAKNAPKGTFQRGAEARIRLAKTKIAEGRAKVAARQAARTAEKQALKQAGKAAAKFGAKAATRWAAEAATGLATAGTAWILLAADVILTAGYALLKKYGKYLVAGAAVLIMLPGLIFAFYFGALGATLFPGTAVEKNQVSLASAFAGDVFETRQVTERLIASETARYEIIKSNLKEYSTGAPADAVAQADGIIASLKELKTEKDKNKAKASELIKALIAKRRTFESKLPFGEWAARAAEELLKLPPGTCPIAPGASANLGCASFVSYVMIKAGIPQSQAAATVSVWQNPNLSLVVPNQTTHQAGYYEANKSKLQRGDIVWWGYGTCGKKKRRAPGGLHCHIGVYLGNDDEADNSSSKAVKAGGIAPVKGKMTKRSDFNGAKRYAPTP